MNLFLLLLCFAGLAPASCNVIQFGSRIKHKTRKSPLSYNTYGCYCSLGGSKQPLDATDWRCHAHDCCYKKLSSSQSTTRCKRWSCDCNRWAAECFQRTARTYRNS
ncbi:group IIE secretory phospholipase A2-like [Aquila chrysaetos chrysaetos]|uniref:group IIE secretory phospholipase A2-like n=1 Tax=Aquila chrysaetos chrysaetos TaxID=223781 RepID=UPI001B7D36AF|nr:group IIE secretory phospholipase A2-like [Aquila chrysaetos chrysaetos]